MALEMAIDEVAEKLAIDPIELCAINDTQVDPEKPGGPFLQRQLVECLRTGADKSNWAKRSPRPGQVRDGRWLVGVSVAPAFRNNLVMKAGARVRLEPTGQIVVANAIYNAIGVRVRDCPITLDQLLKDMPEIA